jgi:DNA-directed RNA polymerase subunit RPC12/RpoP
LKEKGNQIGRTQTGFGLGSKTSFLVSNLFLFSYLVLKDELDPEYLIFLGIIPSMAVFTLGVGLYIFHKNRLITRILYGKKSTRKFNGRIPRECPTCGTILEEDELILISKKKVKCPECEGIFKGDFEFNENRFSGWGIGSLLTFFTANVFVLIRIILDENLEGSILPFDGLLPGFILIGVGLFLAFTNDKFLADKFEKLKKLGRLKKIMDKMEIKVDEYQQYPDTCTTCGEKLDDDSIEWIGDDRIECQYCGAVIEVNDPYDEE